MQSAWTRLRRAAGERSRRQRAEFRKELKEVAPEANTRGNQWRAGDAPSLVLEWAVKSLAKAGTLSIVGLYPEGKLFPIGEALDKNLTIKAGNTPHRKYIPDLVDLVETGAIDPAQILTQTGRLPMRSRPTRRSTAASLAGQGRAQARRRSRQGSLVLSPQGLFRAA